MSLISADLFERALIDPIRQGADELRVVSGYATATMVARHIEYIKRVLKKNISIQLIVGMCPKDGIEKNQHINFQKLQSGEYTNKFRCNYIINHPPVHSKVYTWFKDSKPFLGFVGSANYTQNAFSNSMREILVAQDPNECSGYYNGLIGETVNCADDNVQNLIEIFDKPFVMAQQALVVKGQPLAIVEGNQTPEKVALSLTMINGEVHPKSGLNWGQRGNRNRNEAYIKIPSYIYKSDFFPKPPIPFIVQTDDEKELICVRAQQNGKALESTLNNALLGEYFRYRLGLPNGAFVTKEDLLRYGRPDVDFYKIDDETYFMDFSVK